MKELRKIPNEKLGCRKCEIFGGIYAVTATETDGNMEKKKKKKKKKKDRLPDHIFTFLLQEGTKKQVSGTKFHVSVT